MDERVIFFVIIPLFSYLNLMIEGANILPFTSFYIFFSLPLFFCQWMLVDMDIRAVCL